MKKPKILVNLKTYQRKQRLDREKVRRYLERTWKAIAEKVPVALDTEVTVAFLNNKQMRWYNKTFRKKDYPTDVLSFPVNDFTEENRHYLGDILISMEKTAEQALKQGHSFENELKILLLHGMLHSLGYDHETDEGQMDHLEDSLRKELSLTKPQGRKTL